MLDFFEASTRASLGQRDEALKLLRRLKGRHLGLIPTRDTGFDDLWQDPDFQNIRKELADEEVKTPEAPVSFRLNDAKLIPEGIAYWPTGDCFFLGSVAQRKIVVTDRKGNARDFSSPSDRLDAVLGLRIDAGRGHLYAVSTNGVLSQANNGRRNCVVRYDLKTERLVDRFDAPEALQLNDLTIAPDGTLYVTDSAGGTIFRNRPGETTLKPFVQKLGLPGANGIALGSDGALYVTLVTGIVRVNTTSALLTRLPQPNTVATGWIDGLYWYEGDLIGIQNASNPGRVVRISLGKKGSRISGLTVLQSSDHPDFDVPTTGAIEDGKLFVIGNSYVEHYQRDGTIKDVAELKGTAIIAVPLKR